MIKSYRSFLFLAAILFMMPFARAQKYTTKVGFTSFEASLPSLIPVKATDETTNAIWDSQSQQFAALIKIENFDFAIALMQEHFNENYMESEKFPKASFVGVLTNELNPELEGTLSIRGVKKPLVVPVSFEKLRENAYKISGDFSVKPEDFNIKIPKIVSYKISKQVDIHFDYILEEK